MSLKKYWLKKYYEVIDPLEEISGISRPATQEYIEILTEIATHSTRLRDNAIQTLFMEIESEKEDAVEEAMTEEKEAAQRAFAEKLEEIRTLIKEGKFKGTAIDAIDAVSELMGFTVPTKRNKEAPQVVLRALADAVDTNDYSAEEIEDARLAIDELINRP